MSLVRKIICFLTAVLAAVTVWSRADARPPVVDLALEAGGAALATDSAAEEVKRFGLDLGLWADLRIPGLEALAPQLQYEFEFLPGKSAVHRLGVGARVRLFRFFDKPPLRDDLVFSFDLGYVYAPTTTGDKNWFGYSLGLSYLVTRWSPLHFGPYVKIFQVVFKEARDPLFVTFGISGSFALFESRRVVVTRPRAVAAKEPPEVMAEPNLQGKPGDKDGDGVVDASDLCPITAPAVQVDDRGCMVLKGKMVFPEVHFDRGQTRLSGKALLALKRLADVVHAPEKDRIQRVTVVVWAYAEPSEPAGIAAKRAAKIRDALIRYGVPAAQVRAQAAPVNVVDLDRPLGPWWGRRVVFKFFLDFSARPDPAPLAGGDSSS